MRTETHIAEQLWDFYPLTVENTSSEAAPPYALLRVVSAGDGLPGQQVYTVGKPNGAPGAQYLANGPQAIPAGAKGAARAVIPLPLAVSSSAVTYGADWGPIAGSWLASPGGTGFTAIGPAVASVATFVRTGGDSNGVDHPVVQVFNELSEDLLPQQITGLTDPYYAPDDANSGFNLRVPQFRYAEPREGEPFGVLFNAVERQDEETFSGQAACVGVVQVVVDVTDETHEYAKVENGTTTYLVSAASGPARILWREKGEILGGQSLGEQDALVYLGGTQAAASEASIVGVFAKLTEALDPATKTTFGELTVQQQNAIEAATGRTPANGEEVVLPTVANASDVVAVQLVQNGAELFLVEDPDADPKPGVTNFVGATIHANRILATADFDGKNFVIVDPCV